MILIPENSNLLKETKDLILFFNRLESTLRGKDIEERIEVLRKAQSDLIIWGKING